MKQIFLILLFSVCAFADLSKQALHEIGLKVWQNECRGTLDGLISWNENEEFPSLGIGHFIWYPENTPKKFTETFPALVDFLVEKLKDTDKEIPSWIKSKKGFPWKTREEFLKEKRSKKMLQLRDLLSDTLELQISFLLERFKLAEAELAPHLSEMQKAYLEKLKGSEKGAYALIDYSHFKGTGLSEAERYRGEGWGLLQVLQQMPDGLNDDQLIQEFVTGGKKVLARRVKNAPIHRKEEQWLKGWNQRLETYLK